MLRADGARLVALTEADIPEVMRIERIAAYRAFIGSFTLEHHQAELASLDSRYLGLRNVDGLAGFAILQDFRQPTIRLRRIAVSVEGRGVGTALLRAVLDWVFETTPAAAVRLHVRAENFRARRIYLKEGFADTADGAPAEGGHRMATARERWRELGGG